jgi:hypothetical protein
MKIWSAICVLFFTGFSQGAERSHTDEHHREWISDLALFIGAKIIEDGDNLIVTGTREEVQQAQAKLNDIQVLSQHFSPIGSKSTGLKLVREIKGWSDVIGALEIDPKTVKLVRIEPEFDQNGRLSIPYDTDQSRKIADLYVETLRKNSFFEFACKNLKLIQIDNDTLIIEYERLTPFLTIFEKKEEALPASPTEHCETRISKSKILSHIVAAASGSVALTPVGDGTYRVKTISLGLDQQHGNSTIQIDIVVDTSGSMFTVEDETQKYRITTVNELLPDLIKKLQSTIQREGDRLVVTIYSIAESLTKTQSFQLSKSSKLPVIEELKIDYDKVGTNLSHINELLQTQADEYKIVIAFTDGEYDLRPADKASLLEIQRSGTFALPFLCEVTDAPGYEAISEVSKSFYFDEISNIFTGSCFRVYAISGFFEKLSEKISGLSKPKAPLLLAFEDSTLTLWQPTEHPGVYDSGKAIKPGTRVTYGGSTQVVPPQRAGVGDVTSQSAAEKEAKRAERAARIAALAAALAAEQAALDEEE